MTAVIRVPDPATPASRPSVPPPCRDDGTAEEVGSRFERLVFRDVPLVILAAAAGLAILAGPDWTTAVGPWIWIVSLGVVGLPHGAADLAIGRQVAGRSSRHLIVGGLVYLAGMAGIAALFAVQPVVAILFFALTSIWHFGIGHRDTEPLPPDAPSWSRDGAGPAWAADVAAAVARAGIVLGLPAAAWPEATASVADRLVELLHGTLRGGSLTGRTWFDPSTVRIAGWAVLAAAVVGIVAELAVRRGRNAGPLAIELGVFAAVGWFTDPLFSVGIYYVCWHAWRHLRAIAGDRGPRSLAASVARIHRQGLPLLLPTVAAVVGLWWLLSPDHSARDLAILSIGVYLVVTPSHDVLVRRFRDSRRSEMAP